MLNILLLLLFVLNGWLLLLLLRNGFVLLKPLFDDWNLLFWLKIEEVLLFKKLLFVLFWKLLGL